MVYGKTYSYNQLRDHRMDPTELMVNVFKNIMQKGAILEIMKLVTT